MRPDQGSGIEEIRNRLVSGCPYRGCFPDCRESLDKQMLSKQAYSVWQVFLRPDIRT
jgi:hypothetical protein